MAAFAYSAVDAEGRPSRGILDAASAPAARQLLRARALLPVSVEPTAPGAAGSGRREIGPRALGVATRQLATLIGAGVPVEDALRTVADQGGGGGARRTTTLLLNLRAAVLDGRSLASALGDYPRTFGDFYHASVAAGEASGRLGPVLERLAAHVEARARNGQTVRLALLYPALLGVVSLLVVGGLLAFVVPDIVRVFAARGADLPLLTRALIGLSDAVTTWGPVAALALAGIVAGTLWLLRRPGPRLAWDRALATSRLTRGFVLQSAAAQFTATLATLTVSRVPLMDALRAAAMTVPNLHVRGRLEEAAGRVREGASLSASLRQSGVLPPLTVAMVASGEAGGVLGETLSRAAEDQARDLQALVTALVALVEPLVLLMLGGVVMLLVLAILLPIVGLNGLAG
jgi:general secretion pathway protein F